MSLPSRIATVAGDERGAMLVMFAVFAPVAILMAAFAIDAGNWFLHKRHLQVQADAGALAAAQAFQPCSASAVEAAVKKYAGVEGSPLYNAQIGGTSPSNIHMLINSKTYYNQSQPVDTTVSTKPIRKIGPQMLPASTSGCGSGSPHIFWTRLSLRTAMKNPPAISNTGNSSASHPGHGFPLRAANSGHVTNRFTSAHT